MQPNDVVAGVGIIPLIVGLVAVATGAGLPKAYAPPLALALGVLLELGYVFTMSHQDAAGVYSGVLLGLMFGLAASGLYSGAKTTVIEPVQAARQRKAARQRIMADDLTHPRA